MSVQIFPDDGEVRLLQVIKDGGGVFTLRLLKDNMSPTQDTEIGDFTGKEATFSGYAAGTITWATPTIAAHKGSMSGSAITFTHNGGATANTIYGYYITEAGGRSAEVISVEIFDASKLMSASGDLITITPKITANSEN